MILLVDKTVYELRRAFYCSWAHMSLQVTDIEYKKIQKAH